MTLKELMVVLMVVSGLAAMAIPNFVRSQSLARDAQTRANMEFARAACERYAEWHGGKYSLYWGNFGFLMPETARNPWRRRDPVPIDYCPATLVDTLVAAKRYARATVLISEALNEAGEIVPNSFTIRGIDHQQRLITALDPSGRVATTHPLVLENRTYQSASRSPAP